MLHFATSFRLLVLGVQFPAWDIVSFSGSGCFLIACTAGQGHKHSHGDGAKRPMALITEELSCTEQLARFFPKIPAARVSVRVEPLRPNASPARLHEAVVVEYASTEYAIFVSTLPLEFDDRVRISREGGRSAEACVVALQYHEARKAIAVRFLNGPCEWIKPL